MRPAFLPQLRGAVRGTPCYALEQHPTYIRTYDVKSATKRPPLYPRNARLAGLPSGGSPACE